MSSPFDTIVAPITGTENAAVAVVRLSGPESWEIAAAVFAPWPDPAIPRMACYGHLANGDDGLCLLFEEGHSYTGERSVELSVHGSRASVAALIESCLAAGARLARPGEFTERAFLNGRIDLTQAEGVRDTIESLTQTQLRQANLLREGMLRDQIRLVRREVLGVLASVEASVDFSEEVGDFDREAGLERLGEAETKLQGLLATAEAGRILRRGYRIAIVGPPNAGKSSLLNLLLGFDRAIVTDVPGTTRDFVEESVDLGGLPCVITDTAGLRESEDAVERIGIERARKVAAAADEIWYVFDACEGWRSEDEEAVQALDRPFRRLQNKVDLNPSVPALDAVRISAITGAGVPELIRETAGRVLANGEEREVWINERHRPLLESAVGHLASARATLMQDLPFDLATVHLRAALNDLGEITGETATEDLLERVFSTFCIGK